MIEEDILTIDEVAKYLRVSERTVYEWAQKGEIPAGKIGTVWRFKKTDLQKWVDDRLSTSSLTPSPLSNNTFQMENIVSPDRIIFLDHPSKRDALLTLIDNISTAPQIKNKQELLQGILKRDELMSTAIGRGIAIPHIRLPSITDLVVSVGISRVDIPDFNSMDDEPVRLLFMIAATHNQHAYYLQTLSFFSSRFKNKDLRDSLLEAVNPEDAYRILTGI